MKDLIALYRQCREVLPAGVDLFASQEGEDVLIRRLLKGLYGEAGSYVDVGAYHPIVFSTTLHYYMRGWTGVNIEPNPDAMGRFHELRPLDINLNVGVARQSGELDYHRFREPAFNTANEAQAAFARTKSQQLDTVRVKVEPLAALLDRHLSESNRQRLRFVNVDVEGLEMEVLQSNDWTRYRPQLFLVEALNAAAATAAEEYLRTVDYHFVARTKNTYFYAEREFKTSFVD